jgi:hypothetical protein
MYHKGFILDTLLLLTYVNDILNASREDNINLFADETNLLIFGSNEFELTNNTTLSIKSMCK